MDDDEDELITLSRTLELLGDIPVSTAYEDPELMALKVSMTPPGRKTHSVRFVKRKVLELRAKRIKASEANAAEVMAEVENRIERRRTRQREQKRATYVSRKQEPAPSKPRKLRPKPRGKAEATA